jgi:hypothetical protein
MKIPSLFRPVLALAFLAFALQAPAYSQDKWNIIQLSNIGDDYSGNAKDYPVEPRASFDRNNFLTQLKLVDLSGAVRNIVISPQERMVAGKTYGISDRYEPNTVDIQYTEPGGTPLHPFLWKGVGGTITFDVLENGKYRFFIDHAQMFQGFGGFGGGGGGGDTFSFSCEGGILPVDDGPPAPEPIPQPEPKPQPEPPSPKPLTPPDVSLDGLLPAAFQDFDKEVAGETDTAYRKRLLQPYLALVPDMSEEQQAHVAAILDGANAEMRAIQANTTLALGRRVTAAAFLRETLSTRVGFAFTLRQLPALRAVIKTPAPTHRVVLDGQLPARFLPFNDSVAGETHEFIRQRALRPYLALVPDMSEVQQAHVMAVLWGAAEELQGIQANTSLKQARRDKATAFVFSDLSRRIGFAFTVAQLPALQAVLTK